MTRVVLAAAHLDGDPTINRRKNLRTVNVATCYTISHTI